jgi:two-component system NtrC family response regulator
MKSILIVDDEKNYLLLLRTLLEEEGYSVLTCENPNLALTMAVEEQPQLMITNLKMPGLSGMELLNLVKQKAPNLPVIIMTAFGTIDSAVEAMKQGAFHYILKPFMNEELKLVVKRALEVSELMDTKGFLTQELSQRLGFEELIFQSESMKKVTDLIEQVAPMKTTVLVQGESGTGKELIARILHRKSPRSTKSFVPVNCGGLPETLLESELFGHEKGAFTGAVSRKKGRFEVADHGTLFLDEVSTTSAALQVRLLRVLQEQTFERVGGITPIQVDVRVIAASNRNLVEMVDNGTFREDLFYRLNVLMIEIPPLRERGADILLLAEHFLKIFSGDIGKPIQTFCKEAQDYLLGHHWPGNVRELKNVIERAVVLCRGKKITADDLPLELRQGGASIKHVLGTKDLSKPLPELMEEIEKGLIEEALRKSGGVQARAARLLGISPTNLQYKLGKYSLH